MINQNVYNISNIKNTFVGKNNNPYKVIEIMCLLQTKNTKYFFEKRRSEQDDIYYILNIQDWGELNKNELLVLLEESVMLENSWYYDIGQDFDNIFLKEALGVL